MTAVPVTYPKDVHTAVSVELHLDDHSLAPFVTVEWIAMIRINVSVVLHYCHHRFTFLPPNNNGYTL